MVVWSAFGRLRPLLSNVVRNTVKTPAVKPSQALVPVRLMSGHNFEIVPSKFQWNKFKDMLHFYVMVGAIPWIVVITAVNIFIGPATLAEIPEGYEPKDYEYHRHPISRFIAQYLMPPLQEDYEIFLNYLYEEEEKAEMNGLEEKVRELMARRRDYKLFWHQPVTTKYHQYYKQLFEDWEAEEYGSNTENFP